jgi:YD repeat-containing protein
MVGVDVYSHSGEFSPWAVDLALPGRGLAFRFVRTYRFGRSNDLGPLGRGWHVNYFQRLERFESDILYHDNVGRTHQFANERGTEGFVSPDGVYATLTASNAEFRLQQRYGTALVFATPEAGGRLRSIVDRNGNTLAFEHTAEAMVATDALGRQVAITLSGGRIRQVRDHDGRVWSYQYNREGCLIQVTQPATADYPSGPTIRYEYDASFRLASVTDPNAQTFLRNFYDAAGRVVRQEHGAGVFEFSYEAVGDAGGLPIYRTAVRLKNGARLALKHDAGGHVIERSLHVSSDALPAAAHAATGSDMVAIVTESEFNRHGELVRRVFPDGDTTVWRYDEGQGDPRARGNLLEILRKPAPGVETDQHELTTRFAYEPAYQRCTSVSNARGCTTTLHYDAQGNLRERLYPPIKVQPVVAVKGEPDAPVVKHLGDRFAYNRSGQLTRFIDCRGAVTEYEYYPANDPTGAKGRAGVQYEPDVGGGFLARVRVDPAAASRSLQGKPADLVEEFGYDLRGNVTSIWDGKGNPTHLAYDTHDRPTSITSRAPFNHSLQVRRDRNGNVVESETGFDRFEYDAAGHETQAKTSIRRHLYQYNNLNNVIRATLAGDNQEISHTIVRDAAENIIRRIEPLGNITEYRFDERNLVVERRAGVGASDVVRNRYRYTRSGRMASFTNGKGDITTHHYDGFQRYRGFTDATGTTKRNALDAAANVTRVEVTGDAGDDGNPVSLLLATYEFDALNRCTRRDRAWRDGRSGQPLGHSGWDGRDGVASTVIEYADNHRPLRTWTETGNVHTWLYDGANRVIAASDSTGESVALEYDANGNVGTVQRTGPAARERFQQEIRQEFDELDRLVARSINGNAPERFGYNALGMRTTYRDRAGAETRYLHDAFGRPIGQASNAVLAERGENRPDSQLLVQHVQRNNNGHIAVSVDETGRQTEYRYDALNRCQAVIAADGAATAYRYDTAGNAGQIVDASGIVIDQRFDAMNRLVERRVRYPGEAGQHVETYRFDGLNRLVAAAVPGVTTSRRFDSLSRVLEETQAGRTLGCDYDGAGNVVGLRYPSGQHVRKSYDPHNRVLEVGDGAHRTWAKYSYGAGNQLEAAVIGDVLTASFHYAAAENWLSEVTYRSGKNGDIVAASRYQHDAAGNRIHEEQAEKASNFGERYVYDSAHRLVGAQYGVDDLRDPNSRFEQEVTYVLSPASTWLHRTVADADGKVQAQSDGATNERGAYVSLGDRQFTYHANGNRKTESVGGAEKRRYAYDYANRLVRVDVAAGAGQPAKRVEYVYDAFNRQVLRRVTDASGTSARERVWNGRQLIEEWENGELARRFVYGARINEPVVMTRTVPGGAEDFFYTFNGRGLITGLVNSAGDAVERYRYDAYQQPFSGATMNNAAGDVHPASAVGNPLFAAARVFDSDTQLYTGWAAYDSTIGQLIDLISGYDVVDQTGPVYDDWIKAWVDPVSGLPVDVQDLGDPAGDSFGVDWTGIVGSSLRDWGRNRSGAFFDDWHFEWGGGFWDDVGAVAGGVGLVYGAVGLFFSSIAVFGAAAPGPGTFAAAGWFAGMNAYHAAAVGYFANIMRNIKITGEVKGGGSGTGSGGSGSTRRTSVTPGGSDGGRPDAGGGRPDAGGGGDGGGGGGGSGSDNMNGDKDSGNTGNTGNTGNSTGSDNDAQKNNDTSNDNKGSDDKGSDSTGGGKTYIFKDCKAASEPPQYPSGRVEFTPSPISDDPIKRPLPPGIAPINPYALEAGGVGGAATPSPDGDPRPKHPGVPVDPVAFGIGPAATIGGPESSGPGAVAIVATIGNPGSGGPGDVGIYSTVGGPGTGGPGDVGRQAGVRLKL